jgi:hypothetical protein
MFGFGRRNRNARRRDAGNGGFMGGGLRRAAVLGLGMMAYRWWRNRQAAGPGGARGPAWSAGQGAPGRPATQQW